MAREALAHALAVNQNDSQLRGALRYCDGHLHRINGEARKAHRQTAEAQHEFTEAVSAFREAAELRPTWPDPFLGLMRTFIYGLEDVDRGADALKQAQRLGYSAGERETVQLADGYRWRGVAFARTARTLVGRAGEQKYLARSAEAYRQAIDLYSKAQGYADAPQNLRAAQGGLAQVEQRTRELSGSRARAGRASAFRLAGPPGRAIMAVTYTAAVERNARRARHWTDRIDMSAVALVATSCVAMLAIALAYAGRMNVFQDAGRTMVAPVNLNAITDAAPLDAALAPVFSDSGDRQLAAERLFRFVADQRQKTRTLPNVGAIAPLFGPADFAKDETVPQRQNHRRVSAAGRPVRGHLPSGVSGRHGRVATAPHPDRSASAPSRTSAHGDRVRRPPQPRRSAARQPDVRALRRRNGVRRRRDDGRVARRLRRRRIRDASVICRSWSRCRCRGC